MKRNFQSNITSHVAIWCIALGAHSIFAPNDTYVFANETNLDSVAGDQDELLEKLKTLSSVKYLQGGDNQLLRLPSTLDEIVEYQKIKDGLEILGNRVTVYLDATGNIARVQDDSTTALKVGQKQPQINAGHAVNVAVATLTKLEAGGSNSRLVWFRKVDQGILAWQIETQLAGGGPGSPTHLLTTVDAKTGDLLSQSQRGGNEPYIDPETGEQIVPLCGPIIINDTAGTTAAQNFGANFPSVCKRTGPGGASCTGTLIASNLVLSARHCTQQAGDTVQFGQDSNNPIFTTTVQSVSLPAGPGTADDGGDVSILVLNANVPSSVATPTRFLNETETMLKVTCTLTGYGVQGVGSSGSSGSSNGFRWGGQNVIDRYTSLNIFGSDFDDGTEANNSLENPGDGTTSSPVPLALEAQGAPGDSGGPLLVTNALGENFIIGVASFINVGTSYGASTNWTGTANFKTQIEAAGGDFVDLNSSPFLLQRDNTNDASFHVASNWDPAATPNDLSFLIFDNSAPNYNVIFNNDTGDRTVNNVVVQSDDVQFINPFNSTRHVLTVRENVGVFEQGILTVQGIEVASNVAFVSGTLKVGGGFLPGTSFVTSGPLFLETAILNVNDGNTTSTTDVITGGDAEIDLLSNVVIEDNGSEWNIAGELQVDTSFVSVFDGATLRSTGGSLEGAPAIVTIEGNGSQWVNTGGITSDNLTQVVAISDGGSVSVDGQITNGGSINFDGFGGTLSVPAGVVNSGIIQGLGGSSVVNGSITSNSNFLSAAPGSMLTVTGNVTNTLAALNTGLLLQGTIRIEGNYNGGAINGAATAGTVELAGDFQPANIGGQETGTVRFEGVNLQMEASTTTHIQLASTSDFDVIEVFFASSGAEPDLTLDGQLDVELLNGLQLAAGQTFEIVDYDTFGFVAGTFTNVAEGDVVLTNNGFDLVVRYDLVGSTGSVLLETQPAGGGNPPPNDNWASTISTGAFPFNLTGTNVDATIETGEQQLTFTGATVWWFFSAPDDGMVTINTFGSAFDTQLHIFDGFFGGATVADLNPVIDNDDANGSTVQSEVTFAVTSGTCYEIRVGGFDADGGGSGAPAAQGNIMLNGIFEPGEFVLGDVNCDGLVNLLDVTPFVNLITSGGFSEKADINGDGAVNLLDVSPFIALLTGS